MKRLFGFLVVVLALAGCAMPYASTSNIRFINNSSVDFVGTIGGAVADIPAGGEADLVAVVEIQGDRERFFISSNEIKATLEYDHAGSDYTVLIVDTLFPNFPFAFMVTPR
jgi:hypothetical protein